MPELEVITAPPPPGDEPAGRPVPEHPDAALFPAEVAFLTGKSIRTLEAERLRGGGIAFLKAGRAVRYRRRDVDAWIAANLRSSTSDPGSGERRSPPIGSKA